jgi:hypothetical protein
MINGCSSLRLSRDCQSLMRINDLDFDSDDLLSNADSMIKGEVMIQCLHPVRILTKLCAQMSVKNRE